MNFLMRFCEDDLFIIKIISTTFNEFFYPFSLQVERHWKKLNKIVLGSNQVHNTPYLSKKTHTRFDFF